LVRADMSCELVFRVTNHGRTTVRIEDVTMPLLGPASGSTVQAGTIEPGRSATRPNVPANSGPLASDAIFSVGRDLDPGASQEFRISIVHHPSGCGVAGGWMGYEQAPVVSVESLGMRSERRGNGPQLVFLSKTDLNEC
ncbi:MAG: hypothetical protein ACTHN0_02000, partial [Aquihabitans sp.]